MPKNKTKPISTAIEDYLKAIWLVAQDASASTNDLALQLKISAPSVSSMLGKLREQNFVHYEPYRGVRLTEKGEREALRLLRRHRLIETFLLEHLGYDWGEVHEEAEKLEHAVSDTFTERLDNFLDHPSHDPHGDPIPTLKGKLPVTPNTPFAELSIGETLKIARLMSQDKDVLTYLKSLAIEPSKELQLVKREPVGGLVHVEIDGAETVLSKELAMLIRGEVIV